MTPILMLRRARRDAGLLVVWMALVAFSVALAIGSPRLLLETVDSGARQAVATAGADTDINVTASVTTNHDGFVEPVAPNEIVNLGDAIPRRLPSGLRAVAGNHTLTVLGPSTALTSVNGVARSAGSPVAIRIGMLTPQNTLALSVAAGHLPTADSVGTDVDVVLSAASARASGLSVGSIATVSTNLYSSAITSGKQLTIRVVGIVRERPGSTESEWSQTPNLWKPDKSDSATSPTQLTVLASSGGVTRAVGKYSNPFSADQLIRLDPAKFTAELEAKVASELIGLSGHGDQLAGDSNADLQISSGYGTALADFPERERAAIAQISIMAAGVLGVAAAVLLLVSRLLVARREPELSLERARGASLVSIARRALLETLIIGVVGAALGIALLQLVIPGPFAQPELLIFVIVVVVLAVPVQTIIAVRGTWTGRKVPANRSDRLELVRRVRARCIAAEVTVVALAVAAFVSLASRGLLETQTNGVDLLLASAPLLLAASITIVILRIYRFPVLLAIAAGRRSNGALGLLAAVRARRSIAVLPLLALSLAVSLAVAGGLLASTVSSGQETASWQRIGADVRVHGAASDAQVSRIAATPGVTAVSAIATRDGVQLRLTGGTNFATLVAVDSRYPGLVRSLPAGGADAAGAAALAKLQTARAPADTIPVVVNSDLASQISTKNVGMYVGLKFISMTVVGVTDEHPVGYLASPFIFVDRATLAKMLGHAVPATIVLVNGPGARSAVGILKAPATDIQTRAQWLSARRALALVRGVDRAITLATLATALLAIIALIVTALSGARERGRSLALVRTLGLPARLGWWLALAELAPVLIAALVGGVIAGVGIVVLLEPAMGLGELAGGLGNPAPTISPLAIIALVGSAIALLSIAVLIEIVVRRRDRLSEVLRVGETI